jgi:PII-like signaling protein
VEVEEVEQEQLVRLDTELPIMVLEVVGQELLLEQAVQVEVELS